MNSEETKNILAKKYKKRAIIATIICSIVAIWLLLGNILIIWLVSSNLASLIGAIIFLIISLGIVIVIPIAFYKNYKNYVKNIDHRINEINNNQPQIKPHIKVDNNAVITNNPNPASKEVAEYIIHQDNDFNKSNSYAKTKGLLLKIFIPIIIGLVLFFIIFGVINAQENEWLKDKLLAVIVMFSLSILFSLGILLKLFHSRQSSIVESKFKNINDYYYNNYYKFNIDPNEYINKIPIFNQLNFKGKIFDQIQEENNHWTYTELKIEETGYGKGGGISIPIFKGGILEIPTNWIINYNLLISDINNKEIWPKGYVTTYTYDNNFNNILKVFFEPIPGLTTNNVYYLFTPEIINSFLNIYNSSKGCSFIITNQKIFILVSKLDLFNPKTSKERLLNNLNLLNNWASEINKINI